MALQEARDLAAPELHRMFGPRRRRPRAAAPTEFGAAFTTLGLPQNRVAKLFGVSCRHIRRWQHGNRTVPRAVRLVINLLVAGAISIDQVEAAAQTNGVKPALPARLRDEPEPKPPASLRVEPAPAPVPANPGPTTLAEKVFALAGCRWPLGNPKSPDFRFCARPIARGSYCNAHHVLAYAAQPLPKARPGF